MPLALSDEMRYAISCIVTAVIFGIMLLRYDRTGKMNLWAFGLVLVGGCCVIALALRFLITVI